MATQRNDYVEVAHCLAALYVGNSQHGGDMKCALPLVSQYIVESQPAQPESARRHVADLMATGIVACKERQQPPTDFDG